MTNPTPPSASADNEQLKDELDSLEIEAKYNGYQYYLTKESLDKIVRLVANHTKEAVDKAVLEKAIELRNIAEAHLHESSAAWAIAQEIGAEVSRLKAELAAPAVHKTDVEGSAADE